MTCNLVLNIYFDKQHLELNFTTLKQDLVVLHIDDENNLRYCHNDTPRGLMNFSKHEGNLFVRDLTGRGIVYNGMQISKRNLEAGDVILTEVSSRKVIVIVKTSSEFDEIYKKYKINNHPTISIGKKASNLITLKDKFVSGEHAQLVKNPDGTFSIHDLESKNGVFINGNKVNAIQKLKNGDEINILGFKITFNNDYLAINNVGNGVVINGLEAYDGEDETVILANSNLEKAKPKNTTKKMAPYPFFQRSPRLIPEIPSGEVEITNPPFRASKPNISWISVLLPSIAMAVMSVVMMSVSSGPYIYVTLSMTGVTILISVLNFVSQIRKYKSDEKKRNKSYQDYLANIRQDLTLKRDTHKESLNIIHPDLHTCIQRVEKMARELWERTPANYDFLTTRIGKGVEPLKIGIKIPKKELTIEEDPLLNEPPKIAEEFRDVNDVPVYVSLLKEGTVGVIGDRKDMLTVAKTMAIQLATCHSYDEVKLITVFPDNENTEWEWMKWLPHIWDDNRQQRFIAKNKKSVHDIFTALHDQIKIRENMFTQANRYTESFQLPHLVFFLADRNLIQNEPFMNYLIHNNQHLGISTIFFFDRLELLPKDCHTIIEVESSKGKLYRRESLNEVIKFELDEVKLGEAEYFARKISPIRIKQIASASEIANKVTFLETFATSRLEDLDVLQRWNNSKPYKSLAVPIGRVAGGDNMILDIHEKSHGPHGLVAGTTGSGKSETLQSIILALAVEYHPHDVSFVLIDYKGGGMANCFIGLPHLVGTITNLGGNETRRALLSIKSELKRRQSLLAKYGINNIDNYIRLYKEKKADIPLPHLIIVADEFAELKAEQPDFMRELVSAARVGRSLGIHLILATQKPSGVVDDQIWSNSRFKLCLKVQDTADSQEVIKRPDAAYIKNTGRGFIQVGNDEFFEQFQSAWSGADYKAQEENSPKGEVYLINLDGSRQSNEVSDRTVFLPDKLTQLKACVTYIEQVAEKNNIKALEGPWLPSLPEKLYLDELLKNSSEGWDGEKWHKTKTWLAPIIGMVDNPANQLQLPVNIDLGREGHLAVYGAPGTGKTFFLQTLITSLVRNYSPNEVNIYIMDFGGRTMGTFLGLPHVGGVVFPEDEEKLYKLSKYLLKELEARKRAFADMGVSSIPAYRKATGENTPAIVVMVDNYSALTELYPDIEDLFIPISREGGNYGIHLVVTANITNAIRYKISQNIKHAIAFQMSDRGDYISIVGRTEGLEPGNFPGRGLLKGSPPLEFQTALPLSAESESEMVWNLKELFKTMADKWDGRRAKPIPVLPDILTISELIENDDIKDLVKDRETVIPLGLDTEDMEPVFIDLKETIAFLVSGQINSGKTSFLKTFTAYCSKSFTPEQIDIYVVDPIDSGLMELAENSLVKEYIVSTEDFTQVINRIIEELNIRKRDFNEAKRSAQGRLNEVEYIYSKYPQIVFLVDNLKQFIEMIDDASKVSFERIVRSGKNLGITLIVTGNVDDIATYNQIDSLTKAMVDLQAGIALGGTMDQHNFFAVNMPYQERSKMLLFSEGYYVNKGRQVKTKVAIDSRY